LIQLPLAEESLLFNAAGNPPPLVAKWKGGKLKIVEAKTYEHIQKQVQVPVQSSFD